MLPLYGGCTVCSALKDPPLRLAPLLCFCRLSKDFCSDSNFLRGGGRDAFQVLSCIPMCLSSVYKEKALGDDDIDVIYLNGWVAVFQFLAGLVFAVPSAYAMSLPVSVSIRRAIGAWIFEGAHRSTVSVSTRAWEHWLNEVNAAPTFRSPPFCE